MHDGNREWGAYLRRRAGRGNVWDGKAVTEITPVEHPVVRVHPETGRKGLFVNPGFTSHIVGVSDAESRGILDLLYAHLTKPEHTIRHRWAPGDVGIWDNRSHRALRQPRLRRDPRHAPDHPPRRPSGGPDRRLKLSCRPPTGYDGHMADIIDLIYEDHDYFRRYFLLLDECRTKEELAAVWGPLGTRLDTHAQAEEDIFYPVLLKEGGEGGDPEDEAEDAITDHNAIRDAVGASHEHEVDTEAWWEAVNKAREENGEHLEEEEREALTDAAKSLTLEKRHELAMQWLVFYANHPAGKGVDDENKDAEAYIDEHSIEENS